MSLSKLAVVVFAALFGIVMTAPSQVEAYWGGYKTVSDDFASCLHGKGCGYFNQNPAGPPLQLCSLDFNRNPECGWNLLYATGAPLQDGTSNVFYWWYCADYSACGWSWINPLVPAACYQAS